MLSWHWHPNEEIDSMSTAAASYPQTFEFTSPVKVMCATYKVVEQFDKESQTKSVFFEGVAITFGKPTRNRVSYTYESGVGSHKTLIGKPFLDTHHDDSIHTHPPFGHVVECFPGTNEANGLPCLRYKVDIDPEETTFIRKAKRGDIAGTSIQVLVDDVTEKEDVYGTYIEANIREFLELSAVLIPGDGDTSISLVESFHRKRFETAGDIKDTINTITPDGIYSDKKVLGEEFDDEQEDEEEIERPVEEFPVPISKQQISYIPKYGDEGEEIVDELKKIDKPKKMVGKRETFVAYKDCKCPSCGTQMLKDNYSNGFQLRCWACNYRIQQKGGN